MLGAQVFIGNQEIARTKAELQQHKITHIINCQDLRWVAEARAVRSNLAPSDRVPPTAARPTTLKPTRHFTTSASRSRIGSRKAWTPTAKSRPTSRCHRSLGDAEPSGPIYPSLASCTHGWSYQCAGPVPALGIAVTNAPAGVYRTCTLGWTLRWSRGTRC